MPGIVPRYPATHENRFRRVKRRLRGDVRSEGNGHGPHLRQRRAPPDVLRPQAFAVVGSVRDNDGRRLPGRGRVGSRQQHGLMPDSGQIGIGYICWLLAWI